MKVVRRISWFFYIVGVSIVAASFRARHAVPVRADWRSWMGRDGHVGRVGRDNYF